MLPFWWDLKKRKNDQKIKNKKKGLKEHAMKVQALTFDGKHLM